MDQELKTKIEEQGKMIQEIYNSVEKTRKYFLIIIWVTVIGLVLPLIGIALIGPSVFSTYTSELNGTLGQ